MITCSSCDPHGKNIAIVWNRRFLLQPTIPPKKAHALRPPWVVSHRGAPRTEFIALPGRPSSCDPKHPTSSCCGSRQLLQRRVRQRRARQRQVRQGKIRRRQIRQRRVQQRRIRQRRVRQRRVRQRRARKRLVRQNQLNCIKTWIHILQEIWINIPLLVLSANCSPRRQD